MALSPSAEISRTLGFKRVFGCRVLQAFWVLPGPLHFVCPSGTWHLSKVPSCLQQINLQTDLFIYIYTHFIPPFFSHHRQNKQPIWARVGWVSLQFPWGFGPGAVGCWLPGVFFSPPIPVTGARCGTRLPARPWHLPAKVTGETAGSRPPALGHLLNNVCNKLLPRGQLNP